MKGKLFLFSSIFLLFVFFTAPTYEEDIKQNATRPVLPKELVFAGEFIPDNSFIRERIEREFYDLLDVKHAYTAKLTSRYFPIIEQELALAGLPEDFKYVAIVESFLLQEAYSSASAVGQWQFIRTTAKRFFLGVNGSIDDRRDPYKSAKAAAEYLKFLVNHFNGDKFLALAAYNAGEKNIKNFLKEQKSNDFWSIYPKNETMRYVPRIIAAKVVFSQIEKHFELPASELYKPIDFKEIELNLKKQMLLADIAKTNNVSFYVFRRLNPAFVDKSLPKGKYKIRVPVDLTK
ncbi:MAG: lytic transglycosylase domain-containing protein [Patescibacteria group bacterium]|mgnify:CR=1 FL=1